MPDLTHDLTRPRLAPDGAERPERILNLEHSSERARLLYEEWERMHADLRARERILGHALALHRAGGGPSPDALLREVAERRTSATDQLTAVMREIRVDQPH